MTTTTTVREENSNVKRAAQGPAGFELPVSFILVLSFDRVWEKKKSPGIDVALIRTEDPAE